MTTVRPFPLRHRYRLRLARHGADWTVTIADREQRCILSRWSEPADSGLVRDLLGQSGESCYYRVLSKPAVMDLLMRATGQQIRRERYRRQNHSKSILSLLHRNQGQHYSLADIADLLTLEGLCFCPQKLERHLEDLVDQRKLAQICVPPGQIFYDCNVEPHPHIYNPDTGKLSDLNPGQIAGKQALFIEWPYAAKQPH